MAQAKNDIHKRVSLQVSMRNRTSGLDRWYSTVEAMKPFDPKAHMCTVEFHSDALVLDVPKVSCALGHTVELKVQTQGLDQDQTLEMIGSVVEHEVADDLQVKIKVEFTIFEQAAWTAVLDHFKQAQVKFDELFFSMKGVAA